MTTTTRTAHPTVTFRKLNDDSWGVKGPADVVVEGRIVTVTRSNGATVRKLVGRVLWRDETTALARCSDAPAQSTRPASAPLTGAASTEPVARAVLAASSSTARAPDAVLPAERPATTPASPATVDIPSTAPALGYRADLPAWEPAIGPLTLADNGQDCVRTLGKRTLRKHYNDGAAHADEGHAIAIVGLDYTEETHAMIAAVCDAVTAFCGGRPVLGAARVSVVDDVWVTVRITLPRELADLLTIDGDSRSVEFVLRTSHDGSRKRTLALYVTRTASNAGAFAHGRGGALLRGSHRHTSGIRAHTDRMREAGAEIPAMIGDHARALRTMASRTLTRGQVERACDMIAGVKPADARDATSRERARDMLRMVLAAAGTGNDGRVPRAACNADGKFSALQVFESASYWEHAHRIVQSTGADPAGARMTRSLAGDTLECRAWELLAGETLNLPE